TWLGDFGEGLPASAVRAIEVHGRLPARAAGEHRVGCSGVGRFRLTLDGAVLFDGDVELPLGADPAEALMRPPQQVVAVELAAHQVLEIVLRYDLAPPEGASFPIPGAIFQLNVEPPELPAEAELERAVELAAAADVAIVVVGTNEEVESEGFDRGSLELPGRQD